MSARPARRRSSFGMRLSPIGRCPVTFGATAAGGGSTGGGWRADRIRAALDHARSRVRREAGPWRSHDRSTQPHRPDRKSPDHSLDADCADRFVPRDVHPVGAASSRGADGRRHVRSPASHSPVATVASDWSSRRPGGSRGAAVRIHQHGMARQPHAALQREGRPASAHGHSFHPATDLGAQRLRGVPPPGTPGVPAVRRTPGRRRGRNQGVGDRPAVARRRLRRLRVHRPAVRQQHPLRRLQHRLGSRGWEIRPTTTRRSSSTSRVASKTEARRSATINGCSRTPSERRSVSSSRTGASRSSFTTRTTPFGVRF